MTMTQNELSFTFLVGSAHLRRHLGAVGHLVARLLTEVACDDHLEIHIQLRPVGDHVEKICDNVEIDSNLPSCQIWGQYH